MTFFILFRSLLLWERGLKFKSGLITLEYYSVAPLVGAWIEIKGVQSCALRVVAPLVGAWIEIGRKGSLRQLQPGSLLLWERGLKFHPTRSGQKTPVAPLVGAWIEIRFHLR